MAEQTFRNLSLNNADQVFDGIGDNVGNPQILAWWVVPNNTIWELVDGEPIIAELNDSTPAEIDSGSLILLAGLDINKKLPLEIVQHEYEPHSVLTLAQQNSEEFRERIRLHVPGGVKRFRPRQRIVVALETLTSGVTVANCTLSFRVRQVAEAAAA